MAELQQQAQDANRKALLEAIRTGKPPPIGTPEPMPVDTAVAEMPKEDDGAQWWNPLSHFGGLGSEVPRKFYGGFEGMFGNLGKVSDYLSKDKTPEGGVPEELPEGMKQAPINEGWGRKLEKGAISKAGDVFKWAGEQHGKATGQIPEDPNTTMATKIVSSVLGGGLTGITEFMMGKTYAGLLGAAEAEERGEDGWGQLLQAGLSASERALIGKIFKQIEPMKKLQKMGTFGTVGGLQAGLHGGDIEDIAESAGAMALYGGMGGRGQKGFKDIYKDLKPPVSEIIKPAGVVSEKGVSEVPPKLTQDIEGRLQPRESASELPQDVLSQEKLPKFARGINLEKQDIPRSMKEMELGFAKELETTDPKKVQGWEKTDLLSREVIADQDKILDIFKKSDEGQGVNTQEIDAMRTYSVAKLTELKLLQGQFKRGEITEAEFRQKETDYRDDIFKVASDASSEQGRGLNILKKQTSLMTAVNALSKLRKPLNERQLRELEELDMDNPVEVARFADRLPDPTTKDYFFSFFYNSLLSSPTTQLVNIASNTLWGSAQVPHRALAGATDAFIKNYVPGFRGKEREVFLGETLPLMIGAKKGAKMGWQGLKDIIRYNKTKGDITKWNMDMGEGAVSALERSPHKGLRAIAPAITMPTRGLRGMDVYFKSLAFDAQIGALAHRQAQLTGIEKGLSKSEVKKIEKELRENPTEKMIEGAMEFGKYTTFMDDPGKFTEGINNLRTKVPGEAGRLVIPFVNTIANLTKRGIEQTPLLGLSALRKQQRYNIKGKSKTLKPGKTSADIIAKQIEGSVLALYILKKIHDGEIIGAAPDNEAERERFYEQGKIPWSIKFGDQCISFRRIEPFNTVIASTTIAYNAIMNAEDDEEATEIFGNMVNGLWENLIDSSYLQGVSDLFGHQGSMGKMAKRQLTSLVPFSSFWRSMQRFADSLMDGYEKGGGGIPGLFNILNGSAKVRENSSMLDAFSQTLPIPGIYGSAEPRMNVWGEEIEFPGNAFRQWLPYKWSEGVDDPVENELMRLNEVLDVGVYPGIPKQSLTIEGKKVELPDDIYRDYVISYGKLAKEELAKMFEDPGYKNDTDENKRIIIDKVLTKLRNYKKNRAKDEYIKSKQVR